MEKADIAKGSFYQYFSDKRDLYKYILVLIGEQKADYTLQLVKELDKLNFFQVLREIYIVSIEFARENPRLNQIANNLVQDNSLYHEIMGEEKYRSEEFFAGLIKKGIDNGDIVPEIDPDFTAHILTTLNISMAEYIYEDGQADIDDMVMIDKMLNVIENGIKAKGGK